MVPVKMVSFYFPVNLGLNAAYHSAFNFHRQEHYPSGIWTINQTAQQTKEAKRGQGKGKMDNRTLRRA